MKQFLTVVFGGLAIVALGILVSWGAGAAWRALPPISVPHLAMPSIGVDVPSLTRSITYTADEEEDLVNSAISSIHDPSGKITASAYIVKDLTTGEVWTEYDSERLHPIASLTKLVTAEVARRTVPSWKQIEITPAIIATFGNTAGFRAGETFTAEELMYPLLMVSSNDAAEALARSGGTGSRGRFIHAMNDFVQEIGAYRTYFDDPSGLSPQDVSTASDMAVIIDWIRVHDPALLDITLTRTHAARVHTWVNPTHFLSWSYYMGGKNGFTDEAKKTGVSLFHIGPAKDVYAIVVLGSDNRDEDVIRLINKVK